MKITEQTIFRAVIIEYCVAKEQVLSESKSRHITDARHMVMYLLYKEVGYTLCRIAEIFKCKHPSICYAIKKMQYFIKYDKETRLHYLSIRTMLAIEEAIPQVVKS